MVKLNGDSIEFKQEMTVADFLASQGYQTRFIAVEINGMIVPKVTYQQHILHDGDAIEVVRLVGGG